MTIAAISRTAEFSAALSALEGGKHLFLTGKAGTGKSTLIRTFLSETDRNAVVVAPTGIAALNVSGYTIHRLFSFRAGITSEEVSSPHYFPGRFANALRTLEVLIVDEVSMLRADLFDCVAAALARYGPKPGALWGGVQLVLVGDLFQLPPVVTTAEAELFASRYPSPYFFSADAYGRSDFQRIELTRVFRQLGDARLADLLNAVRDGVLLDDARAELNTRTSESFRPPAGEFWLTLTTTNRIAAVRNQEMLDQLATPEIRQLAHTSGQLDGFEQPAAAELVFKIGAQVMLLTNAPNDRWVNGTIAEVAGYRAEQGKPVVIVRLPGGGSAEVRLHTWEITRPVIDDGRLRHEVIGSYTQLPIRLAWAITIHKSQGQTLDRLVVDLTGGTFADGQLYVALSRCTSLAGLVLRRSITARDLRVDQRVRRFLRSGDGSISHKGYAFLGICTVGDEGRTWRPRPVEIALVTDSGTEISTLIDPDRDLGAARAEYGITASDVQFAPTLAEAWPALEPYLADRVLVGLDIDQCLGYLDYELKRSGLVVRMPVSVEASTWELSPAARAQLGAATALERARAVRECVPVHLAETAMADVFVSAGMGTGYLLERGNRAGCFRVGGSAHIAEPAEVLAAYLRKKAHRLLDTAAWALLSEVEADIGRPIRGATVVETFDVDRVLIAGARVCFTGTVIDATGGEQTRADLEERAAARGLVPVGTVTKKKCDVLVVAEAGSRSRKAKAAAAFGKPVITAAEFLAWAQS